MAKTPDSPKPDCSGHQLPYRSGHRLFEGRLVNPSAPIACHTNLAWTYTLPYVSDMDKRMHATLLLAYATGRSVTLRGSGTCADFGSIESAISVRLEAQ